MQNLHDKNLSDKTGIDNAHTKQVTQVVSLSLEAELDLASHQLQSGCVSIANLDESSRHNNSESSISAFVELYKAELDRISDNLTATGHGIERNARALLLHADALLGSCSSSGRSDMTNIATVDLQTEAKSLAGQSLKLHEQTKVDAKEFCRIAALADFVLGKGGDDLGLSAMTERRFELDPWRLDNCGGTVIVLLSDIYTVIREIDAKLELQSQNDKNLANDADKKWQAPTSFERVTTKYWVTEEHLYQVLLASVADLPLLVYGRKGGRILDQRVPRRSNTLDSSLANSDTPNSSLWTSSLATSITSVYFDSPDMAMYSERLKRGEGAQLFRIRWYGAKPRGDENVFLELKTHHEQWIGNSSIKERVAIQEKDVLQLLDVNNESWDKPRASKIVRQANPTEDEESIMALTNLLLRIKALVCKHDLTSCVRTKYTRVALQSASTNKLRLTIDHNLMVINERYAASSESSSWCIEDSDTIPKRDIVKIPYNVYEVKVAGADGPPSFINELENSTAIVEAKKFSKFLSGASIFNADKIATLPWWASDAGFAHLYQKDTAMLDNDKDSFTAACGGHSSMRRPSSLNDAEINSLCSSNPILIERDASNPVSSLESVGQSSVQRKGPRRLQHMSLSRLSFYQLNNSALDKPIAPKTRLRVEPKSHFANERTFIQWISVSLLFITFSQLLFILAAQNDVKEANIAATWMVAMSLFMAVYSLSIYYRRVYLMMNGKPYGYVDFVGPGILTASVISGVILLMIYTSEYAWQTQKNMAHQAGNCVRRSFKGVPVLEAQPSGALVDNDKGILLVPSLNRIIALKDGIPTEEENNAERAQVVATLQGTNMEALEFVGENIFALSEDSSGVEIISLKWSTSSLHLEEVYRWVISSSRMTEAEGMVLVPGEDEASPHKLIVAGGVNGDLSLRVYDLDLFVANEMDIKRSSKLNPKIIAKGLVHKKVGAMQYFEGLLYVLFDNDRVIRAFDLLNGQVVQETTLPLAEEGSEFQWEGMRLQRIKNGDISGLRGTSEGTTLVIHLALDTPAQVWTLRLNEEKDGGRRWTLPECALGGV